MPVNYTKEYLIFFHSGAVLLPFCARASNGRHYSNFQNKNLKFEIYIIFYIYFKKMTDRFGFAGTGRTLLKISFVA